MPSSLREEVYLYGDNEGGERKKAKGSMLLYARASDKHASRDRRVIIILCPES